MAERMTPTQHAPVSEGIDYGPFPLPDADQEPRSAQWLMDEAGHVPELYQLLRLKEVLETRNGNYEIDEEIYQKNTQRLGAEIARMRIKHRVFNRPNPGRKNI